MTEEEIKSEHTEDPVEDKEITQDQSGESESQSNDQPEDNQEASKQDEEEVEEEPEEMVEIAKSRLEELENAEAIALENLKRERAESINYRKRLERQRNEFAEMASARVLSKVLAVQDDLRRVIENSNGEIPDTHMEGIQLVQQRLEGVFNQEGVELIKIDEGKTRYDPKMMEAVVSQPIPDVAPNTVMGVINQGFKKGDRVLRAAKVMISKAPVEESSPKETEPNQKENQNEESEQTQDGSTDQEPVENTNGEN